MKYIKRLNIDFNNWDNIPMTTNEQQIKELHPIFYQFLIKNKLMNIYLEMFNKCHWEEKGDTFEEIMNNFKYGNNNFLLKPIYYTLNYFCINKHNKHYYFLLKEINFKFKIYYKKKN